MSVEPGSELAEPPRSRGPNSGAAKEVHTLADLYVENGPPPKEVARGIRRGEGWAFGKEAMDAALRRIPERDPDLKRTRSLVHELAADREMGLQVVKFGALAISPDVAEFFPGWARLNRDESVDAAEALKAIAAPLGRRARKPSRPNDVEAKLAARRAHHALMIGVDYLAIASDLSAAVAVPILREALGEPDELSGPRVNPRLVRLRALSDAGLGRERVRALLELLQPWIDELNRLENEVEASAANLATAELDLERESKTRASLESALGEVRKELDEERQESARLRDHANDTGIRARGDLEEVRGRVIAALNTQLRSKLETANEALGADPPRTKVTKRKIEDAIDEIEVQLKWLRSSE